MWRKAADLPNFCFFFFELLKSSHFSAKELKKLGYLFGEIGFLKGGIRDIYNLGKENIRQNYRGNYAHQVCQKHGGYGIPRVFNTDRTKINGDHIKRGIRTSL